MRVRKNRGVALILVLGAVAILSVLAVELAARANQDVMMASRYSREAAYRRLFDSATEVARGLLTEPEVEKYDYWGERWNDRVRFTLGPGLVATLRVSDESGKINIAGEKNRDRLRSMLHRFFEYKRTYEPSRSMNWEEIEAKVLLRLGYAPVKEGEGEEGEPEESTDPKNPEEPEKPDPLLTLDGLREAGLSAREVFGKGGLSRYLTTFGDGKINLNTAPRAVLYALGEDFDLAITERIAEYRGGPDGGSGVYKPFEETKDLTLVDGIVNHRLIAGQPKVILNLHDKVKTFVTTESTCFSVEINARVGEKLRKAWCFFSHEREARAGEPLRRTVKFLAFEDLLP